MIFVRTPTNIKPRDLWLLHVLPAALVFIAVMLIIILNIQGIQRQSDADRRDRAINQAQETEARITERISTYDEAARATAAFINSSQEVTRGEFDRFFATLQLQQRYQQVQDITYAQYVQAAGVGTFTMQQRQSGAPDFAVYPDITDGQLLVTSYVVTKTRPANAALLGFNILSEPVRADAVKRAVSSGTSTLSAVVRSSPGNGSKQGFILYTPVYKSEELPTDSAARQSAATGVISMSFIADTFFSNVMTYLQPTGTDTFGVSISQGNNPPMFVSSTYNSLTKKPGARELQRTLSLNGTKWMIRYAFTNGTFGTGLSGNAIRALLDGLVFAALLAALVLLLLLSRTRSLNHAEERQIQNAKDDLLSLASHQLRTPATSVKQYLGMVKDGYAGDLSEQQTSLIEEAYASNERQLGVINEMLYVARADAGRIVLDREPLALNKLLRDIHKEQSPRARSHQQRMSLLVPKMDVVIHGDSHYLRMAVENIVNNAIKYTQEKGTITVKLTRTDTRAVIAVTDSGVGISKADYKKLFQKFSRIPNELSTQTNGTGVGLYLSKQIVELHSGTITFASNEGKGTTFTVSLPRTSLP